jgi:hydrogenase expression/formation protein HypC
MCIGFPGRVVAVDSAGAVVETDGRRRRASMLLAPDTAVGDWVVVGAGTILERLDDAAAADMERHIRTAMTAAVAETTAGPTRRT